MGESAIWKLNSFIFHIFPPLLIVNFVLDGTINLFLQGKLYNTAQTAWWQSTSINSNECWKHNWAHDFTIYKLHCHFPCCIKMIQEDLYNLHMPAACIPYKLSGILLTFRAASSVNCSLLRRNNKNNQRPSIMRSYLSTISHFTFLLNPWVTHYELGKSRSTSSC